MIRQATIKDAHGLAGRVRIADRKEIAAASGSSPLKALLSGARHSAEVWAFVCGKVQALYGVVETAPGEGGIWMIGANDIFGRARWPFARVSRSEVDRLQARWPKLHGRVHAANRAHVRWLEWCGFKLSEPVPWGVSGELFHEFERTAYV